MADPVGCFGWALLPLRRYAEFGGRSRRTELVTFYLFFSLLSVPLNFAVLMMRSPEAAAGGWLFLLALLCPTLALAVRRLHDSGRAGWWLLLAVPGLALTLWHDFFARAVPDPEALEALAGLADLAGLGLVALLLWNDDPEPNRYGPNPRFDPPEPDDQGLA